MNPQRHLSQRLAVTATAVQRHESRDAVHDPDTALSRESPANAVAASGIMWISSSATWVTWLPWISCNSRGNPTTLAWRDSSAWVGRVPARKPPVPTPASYASLDATTKRTPRYWPTWKLLPSASLPPGRRPSRHGRGCTTVWSWLAATSTTSAASGHPPSACHLAALAAVLEDEANSAG